MSTRLAEDRDRAEADSREKETKYLALSRALQVKTGRLTLILVVMVTGVTVTDPQRRVLQFDP